MNEEEKEKEAAADEAAKKNTATTPAKSKKAAGKEEETQDLPDELTQTPHQRGDEVLLNLGVASAEKIPGTVTGVYIDADGLTYNVKIQTADGVPLRGNKPATVEVTVPASIVEKQ